MTAPASAATDSDSLAQRRLTIGFLHWAHAIDHFVILIFPTVVLGLEAVYGRSYAELIALGTASFVAFGVFSLPAGWLADRWSRRNMMAAFYIGCGAALIATGFAEATMAVNHAVQVINPGARYSPGHSTNLKMLKEREEAEAAEVPGGPEV